MFLMEQSARRLHVPNAKRLRDRKKLRSRDIRGALVKHVFEIQLTDPINLHKIY